MVTKTINSDSEILRRINSDNILDEINVFLRNNITDRRSRTTTTTESFTGDGTTTVFELTGDLDSKSRHKLMNIKTLTVASVSQTNFQHYIAGYRKTSPILGKVQFWDPPADSTVISVKYGHTSHFIYPESPRLDLGSRNYPRITTQINSDPQDAAVGGKATRYEIFITLTVIDETRDFVEAINTEIRRLFAEKTIREGFWNFQYILIKKIGKILPTSEDINDTMYGCLIELSIPFEYEYSK